MKWTRELGTWRNPILLDLALASLVALLTVVGTAQSASQRGVSGELDAPAWAILTISGLAVVGVRKAPLLTLAVVVAAHALYLIFEYPEGTEWLPTGVAIAGAAAAGFRWAAVVVGFAGVASMMIYRVLVNSFEWLDAEVLLAAAGLSTALVAGEWIRARREYIVSAVERARLAELGREEEARRRVDEERLRIAREMHDVLAHALA
jgi:signal transduction histidine kinase